MAALILIGIVTFCGAVSGLLVLSRWRRMESRVVRLEREIRQLQRAPIAGPTATSDSKEIPSTLEAMSSLREQEPPREENRGPQREPVSTRFQIEETGSGWSDGFLANMRENWMVWLGGVSISFAAIFMARYSIEHGLLSPTARIAMGFLTGVGLLGGAEWLRRRTGETTPSFAAMAGAGSFTLYAVVLAGLHLVELFSPGIAFLLLALIGVGTMAMAYLHGPAVAAIGILGAYAVPVLIGDSDGSVLLALMYSLVITGSALLLLRYVYREWLWYGVLIGALFWWLATAGDDLSNIYRGWYLAALTYMLLSIKTLDWGIAKQERLEQPNYSSLLDYVRGYGGYSNEGPAIAVLLSALLFTMLLSDADLTHFYVWAPLALLLTISARSREGLVMFSWPTLLLLIISIGISVVAPGGHSQEMGALQASEREGVFWALLIVAAVTVAIARYHWPKTRFPAIWASLGAVTPALLLAAAYFVTSRFEVSGNWAILAAVLGLGYLGLAVGSVAKRSIDSVTVWLFFAGHFAVSLAAVMILREASLTLVLAIQPLSIIWLSQRFAITGLDWLLKVFVTLVICRLTLNPWLTGYPTDMHWPLWTAGGATFCFAVGTWMLRGKPALSKWMEGGALHTLVLTLAFEARYWIHDGEIFASGVTAMEVGLYIVLAGSLSIVYQRRSQASQTLAKLYSAYSKGLLFLSICCYATVVIATLGNSPWLLHSIDDTPFFNLMLLYYFAPVAISLLVYRYHSSVYRHYSIIFAAVAGFLFITIEIRMLFNGSVALTGGLQSTELYTYSAVWLLLAITAMVGGLSRWGHECYKGGLILLGVVIAKLFLIDMSGLEGLLRISSFMGLGLGLLGVAYIHRRLSTNVQSKNDLMTSS